MSMGTNHSAHTIWQELVAAALVGQERGARRFPARAASSVRCWLRWQQQSLIRTRCSSPRPESFRYIVAPGQDPRSTRALCPNLPGR